MAGNPVASFFRNSARKFETVGYECAVIWDFTGGGYLAELLTGQNLKLPKTALLQITGSFCISLASKLRTYTMR
jgi:hypothetical protein